MHWLDGRQPAAQWPPARTPYEEKAAAFGRAWQGGQTAFVLHTSGSTGVPKPITLSRSQMLASARLTGQTFDLRPGDTALCCLNIEYVAGAMMLVRALTLGLRLALVEPSAAPLASVGPETPPFDLMAFVPLQLQTLLEGPPLTIRLLNSARVILLGGAAASPALQKALQRLTSPVYATYGMTETVSHVALQRLNGPAATDFFTALPGVELDVDGRGCLNIRAAATDWLRVQTNDVIEWLGPEPPYRSFRLLGRADSIINTGGVKVQPERVERVLNEVLASRMVVPRLFVAGLPDERLGQRITLVVEGDKTMLEAIEQARPGWSAAIRAQLGPYAVPKDLIFAAGFRETPTGKLDRRATLAELLSA